MKSKILYSIILSLTFLSCNSISLITEEISMYKIFTEQITIKELLSTKEIIDNSKNPAEALLLKDDLSKKILTLENIIVKDIIISPNVDYSFCVLADIQSEKGPIECYIYTTSTRRISQLKKGLSVITVKGRFKRYFSMLDNYYTKIEITNSDISIKKD